MARSEGVLREQCLARWLASHAVLAWPADGGRSTVTSQSAGDVDFVA
ncbi:MAG: hypothetical protein ABTQ25_03040 [Nitrosomonas ureae]